MVTLKDLVEAGIKVEEKTTDVIEYSNVENIENLDFDDLEEGDYTTYEVEEKYYDNAINSWYVETPDLRGYDLNIEDLKNIAENAKTTEEFIENLQKIYD